MPPPLRLLRWLVLMPIPAFVAAVDTPRRLSVLNYYTGGVVPTGNRTFLATALHDGGGHSHDDDSVERIARRHRRRRRRRRRHPLRRLSEAIPTSSGEQEGEDKPALLWSRENETTCLVTSFTWPADAAGDSGRNVSSSSYRPNPGIGLGLTGVVPGCGSTGTTFLSLHLLRDDAVAGTGSGPGPSTAASAAGAPNVRNASGVFGKVHKIYAGANYSLDLVVQLNLDDVLALDDHIDGAGGVDDDDDVAGGTGGNYRVPPLSEPPDMVVGYVRLVLCDALHIGSCDDALRSSDTSNGNNNTRDSSSARASDLATTEYTNVLDNIGNLTSNGSNGSNGSNDSSPSPQYTHPNRSDVYEGGPDATYLPLGRWNTDVVAGGGGGNEDAGADSSSILSSPWLAVTLRRTAAVGDDSPDDGGTGGGHGGTTATFRVRHIYNVSLPHNVTSGAFFVMGHSHFLFDYAVLPRNSSSSSSELNGTIDNNTTASYRITTRLDMTRALSDAAAFVTSPPFKQTTTTAIRVYLIVISVVCGAFALLCFASIIYHRTHPVMTLSQGSFLAALVAACFIQIVFAFTYLPTISIYCTLSGPLELIPMNVGGAILVARVWRAYSALGVAALIGRRPGGGGNDSPPSNRRSKRTFELLERWHLGEKYIQTLSWLARLPLRCLGKDHRDPMRHTVRKKVTATETASLAVMLSLPQVILQVFGAAYYQRGLELQLDATESIGRDICQAYGRWVDLAGIGLVGMVYIGAVAAAWIARLLPSVFNEKNQVFHAAFVNCLIAFITMPLLELTNDPTDSPDVQVFLRSLLSIGIAMTNIIVLVLPKLRRVWSGEKVVLTNVLDARFKAASTAGAGKHTATKAANDERINLKEGDPLPYPIEQQVLRLHDVLRTVEDRCCEGRPLARDEWSRLRECTHSLNAQLLRVDITYNHDTDDESPTT